MSRRLKQLLTAGLLGAAVVLVFRKRRGSTVRQARDIVDEASMASFPASDPPSWTSAALATR